MHRHFATFVLLFCLCTPAFGDEVKETPVAWVTAAAAVDGDTFTLDQPVDGATAVNLVGIQAPQISGGPGGIKAWPLAERSRDSLSDLVQGREVALRFTGPRADRHGRLLAHVYLDDGTWIQGEMLKHGLARVFSFSDNRALSAEMLSLEDAARNQKRGIWSDPFYAIRTPEDVERHIGSFQIVEGRVVNAVRVKRYVYLNFGEDWRTDFTVSVPVKNLRRFDDAGLDLLSLTGRDIRVRGWLKEYSGAMIDATHPEQIEVLGPPSTD